MSQSSSSSDSGGPTLSNFAFSPAISVKLDDKNYLVWKQQVEAVLKIHRMQRFVVNPQIPSRYESETARASDLVSDSYLRWEQKDQVLFTWLLSSLSDSLLTRVVGCVHSWQVWDEIHNFLQAQNRAKIRQFRSELRTTVKGTRTVSEYLLRIKALIDSLIAIGHPISSMEHVEVILDGLLDEYESFITSINNRSKQYSVNELESLLLAHEARVDRGHGSSTSESFSINLAQGKSSTVASNIAQANVASSPTPSSCAPPSVQPSFSNPSPSAPSHFPSPSLAPTSQFQPAPQQF